MTISDKITFLNDYNWGENESHQHDGFVLSLLYKNIILGITYEELNKCESTFDLLHLHLEKVNVALRYFSSVKFNIKRTALYKDIVIEENNMDFYNGIKTYKLLKNRFDGKFTYTKEELDDLIKENYKSIINIKL